LPKFVNEAHDVGSHTVDLATNVLSNEIEITGKKDNVLQVCNLLKMTFH